MGILKSLFGGGPKKPALREKEAVEYKGFRIVPAPAQEPNGWRIGAVISKEIDGQQWTYHMIRADVFAEIDFVVDLTIRKAKLVVDEQGEKILVKPSE
ncbi:MAG TPA: HlyU family transcriptional regulator [Gammaproteobacteria bacterium]